MLASLTAKDGNSPLIEGFNDNIEPLKPGEDAILKKAAAKVQLKAAAENVGVARFISDDPYTILKVARYGTAWNLDGIWGGSRAMSGAWPAYLFTDGPQDDPKIKPLGLPLAGGGAGHGAANEHWVIEGAGKVYGMAGAEKSFATILCNYAASYTTLSSSVRSLEPV